MTTLSEYYDHDGNADYEYDVTASNEHLIVESQINMARAWADLPPLEDSEDDDVDGW